MTGIHSSKPRLSQNPPRNGSILLRLRVRKKAGAHASAFFRTLCGLFIEGADPLKHPWVGLAPSEMHHV